MTETIASRQTALLAWSPDRPGNWLFHCHLAFHVIPEVARLDTLPAPGHEHMAGLVLGIEVKPSATWQAAARPDPRQLRFVIDELPKHRDSLRTIGVAIDGEGPLGTGRSPGPVLVVTRDQPTDITIVNHLAQPTAIHWHGLELESMSDGVAGMSGMGPRRSPPVMPGDSFVAHLTMPRAGTFIYHTHLHDVTQLTAGLYGPIVVLPPGQTVGSAARPPLRAGVGRGGRTMTHPAGQRDPYRAPLKRCRRASSTGCASSTSGPANASRLRCAGTASLVTWQPVGRDGADLPPALTLPQPARQVLDVGNTFDVRWTPAPGRYLFEIGTAGTTQYWSQVIVAR